MKTAIFGVTGFIGRWVARELTAAGADLTLVVRDSTAVAPLLAAYGIQGRVVTLDVRDAAAVHDFYRQVRPSITFNLVGYGVDRTERDETLAYQINATFPETLALVAAQFRDPTWPGQHLIHVGSALEYGVISGNLAEDAVPAPTTLYGRSKLAGTLALTEIGHREGLRVITARLFTVYGPGEHNGRLLPSLLHTAQTLHPLPLTTGEQQRDFTYVGDVACGLRQLAGLETADPVLNLATGRLTAVRQFIQIAADVLHIPPHLLQFGALPTRQEEQAHADVAIHRLRHHLHWVPPTPIADGIRQTHHFLSVASARAR